MRTESILRLVSAAQEAGRVHVIELAKKVIPVRDVSLDRPSGSVAPAYSSLLERSRRKGSPEVESHVTPAVT